MNCKKLRKTWVVFALLLLLTSFADSVWGQTVTLPTVVTNEVNNVTAITARGNGNVTDDGGAPVTERGICWGTNQNPNISGTHLASESGTGYFVVEMTDLEPNTTYYVRAYATNSAGTAYGIQRNFTTPVIEAPTVATLDVIHIRNNSAVGVARVTSQGNDPTTERGVCWSSTNSTPTISDSHATSGMGQGNYSVDMFGLQANTTYYIRAYAQNSAGIAYGDVLTFFTQVHMQNGTIEVDDEGFDFTDSEADDGWYVHNEDYTLVFIPESSSNGVKIDFESLLINNDFLYFYDGDISDNNLIGVFTCNEYHAYKHGNDSQISVFGLNGNIFTVTSHSYMTVRFVSDYHWRDAGWVAHVSQVPFTPQPPAVAKLACTDDTFELLPTSKGKYSTTLKYAIAYGGENPGEPNTEYTVGTPININGSYPVKIRVKTEVVETEGADPISSSSRLFTFGNESLVEHPDAPTITPPASGTSTVTLSVVRPGDLNDTWKILYTLDGSNPSTSSTAQAITATTEDPNEPHDVTTSGTVALYDFCEVRAVVQGTTCPNIYSEITSYIYNDFNTIYLVPPTISFAGNGSTASTTIIPPTEGCIIYYTVNDGSTQIYSSPAIDGNPAIAPTPFMVNANDRVKAWVDKPGPNYVESGPAVSTYLPNIITPGIGTGVYGRVVYLDDREPHGWSYYSDTLQPVHSLNPVDVKITYFGDGTGNMTNANENQANPTSFSANATGTMVNIDAPENQFVYYETLECGTYVDEQNGYFHLVPDYEGESGTYPYTTIPNPFQVRPVFGSRESMGGRGQNNPQHGNNRETVTEDFESCNVGAIPDGWCNNCVPPYNDGWDQNVQWGPTVSTGNGNFDMGQGNKFMLFQAQANNDGFGNAFLVLPECFDVTAISFDYRCNGNDNNCIRVGCYYDNVPYVDVDDYEVRYYANNDNIQHVTLRATDTDPNISALFGAINSGGRIVFRLFNYANNIMYAGIDNVSVNYAGNPSPANPVFNYPNGYTFEGLSASITVTDETANVTIHYTLDGSEPTADSPTVANGGTVTVDVTHPTLKAIAIRNGHPELVSAVTTATYSFNLSTPVFNPDGGVITGTGSQVVTISNPDVGTTTVYYTLDGSIPTTDSPHFDGASITVTVDTEHPILKAIAIHNENPELTSALHTAIYTFRPNNPVITPDGGLIFDQQTVSISLSGEGTIYYTTDGSVPDPDHVGGSYPTQIYQGPFTVNGTTTVRAIAHASFGDSDVVEAVYVLGQTVTNNNQYRGFYRWRIERISGGKIYDANGNEKKAYASGLNFDEYTVNAEERLIFEPDSEYGMEVDYVALWAQAYIGNLSQDYWGNWNVNGLDANVSYERNFLIGETQIRAINYPTTYSSYYPNGAPSNNASSNVTLIPNNNNNDRYFLSADTKFENMNFNYDQRIVGNNHNLCFGRGINTVSVPYSLEGINSTENNGIGPLDYTIRIESGRFDMLSFLLDNFTYGNGQKHRIDGRYLVKGIMGSDYDRAKNDNSKLFISCNTGVRGRLFLSYGTNGSDPVNKDKETFNLVVKSGSYQNQYWDNGGEGQYNQSFYVGENASSGYPGVRFITVEGGEFGSMNGGRGSGSSFQYADPEVVTSSIRIKGGTFHGSVFGAAADNQSIGGRRIVVTGLQDENRQPTTLIQGWIAGGCNGNGQGDETSDGSTDGNSYIYVGGYAAIGGDSPITVNGTQGGQVFGAGRGMYGRRSCINNSYVVIADSSYVTNNVYGGGHHGYITEVSSVYIIGGLVGQDVYGGAFEHDTIQHTINNVFYDGFTIPATRVYVRDGEVRGCVYGGSNNVGFIGDNDAIVEMTGGVVGTTGSFENGNVFGGGNGLTTRILSNTIVTVNGGLVVNNVYGGGNEGKVEGKATVNIVKKNDEDLGSQIGDVHSDVIPTKGNVYGGGKGKKTKGTLTYVNETEVNIVGSYIMGSVFGGGENGIVKTNTVVNVEGGQVGGYPGETSGGEHVDCDNPYHGSVYGGGSGLNYENGEMVEGTIEDGWVKGNSTVNIISGAHVMRNVYGGSNVASVGLYQGKDNHGFYNQVPNTGLATVNISGGIIGTDGHNKTIYGDNNEVVDVVSNGMVFGSSHGKAVIGKKDYAHVNETHVIISAGADVRGSVFGGGDDGFVLGNTLVEIIDGTIGASLTGEESEIDPYGSSSVIYTGNVYGGGRGIDRHNDTISTIAGFVKGNTEVRMTGGLVRHNVYGGGSLACVGFKDKPNTGKATVHVNGGQVGSTGRNNGRVFGSGRGMPATPGDDELMKYANLAFTNNTYVTIDGVAKVMGAVFGGGENGHVFHKTKVTIDGDASIGSEYMHPFTGDVYGGGRGVDRYGTGLYDFSRTAGKVYEETEVNINDGTIYHAVYGGGTMASVGQIETSDGTPTGTPYYYSYDDETLADAETGYLKLKPTTDVPNNGRTVVNISGGVIGTDGANGDGNGNVFGSAKGWAGSQFKHLAYTGNTDVNISGGHIMGSAFGGGENGHVLGSTDIEVWGGEIGLTGSRSTLMGNVFGGGCGTDKDLNGEYSLTAGWVKFNTNTLVRGGSIYRNVYGGGNLASVGYAENHNAEFSGRANVLIKENAVIGIDGNENGHVFGSGYGRAATESGADTIYAQMAFVKNTFVTIQDDAEVKGSVFGSGENGHVRQNTHVFVEGGEIGTDGTTGYEGNVYGGGRGKDLNANNDYSRTSGRTYGNTFVDISGGKVNGSVFGGGRMATVGTYPAQDTIPADPDFNNGGETGRATVYIHGGVTIGNANTALRGGNVYGGAKGLVGTKYAHLAYLKNTEVIIKETATINGSVFGGGENGHVSENTKVAIYNGTIGFAGGNEYKGNVFGGGRGIDRDADGNQTETAGIVKGSTRVFFEGGTAHGSVFGGGNASLVSLEKVVNINGGDVMKNVFGGCKQVAVDKADKHPGTKTVNMRGGHVYGSVFGCSNNSIDGNFEEGHEKDWTAFVNISGGTIDGNVHGLGYAGEVIGSSEVNVGVNAIAEKVNGEWSDLSKRNVDNIYFDDRAYLPTVLTTGLFDVTDTSAEVDGYVSAIANSNVTERGICWGTSPEPTTKVQATTNGDGRGYYTLDLTGLTPSTTYYVRAYAINDKGTTYGAEISFTTDAAEPNYATAEIDRDEHEGKIEIENAVSIGNSVYAGSSYFGTQGNNVNDWTHYDATGYTNIYIDGTGYDTETEFDPTSDSGNSMNIGGGVFGSGTHCEAGLSGHNVLMREYGHRNVNTTDHGAEFTSGTRTLTTIQRCQNLLLDNVNINITGFNDINTTYNTNKLYSVVKVDDTLYMANASAIAIGDGQPAYMDSIFCVRSVHLNVTNRTIYDELDALEDDDLTNIENDSIKQNYGKIPSWEWIAVNPNTGSENTAQNARLYYRTSASTTPLNYTQENVILFNDFSQLWVRYHRDTTITMYGELQGFFRMDSDFEPYGTESFAFARPKITGANNNNILSGNAENPYLYAKDNLEDGGFLSYKVNDLGGDYPNGYNFFTEPGLIGGWNYPVDGDDGGEVFTKTKQYPYINVYPITRDNRHFYRMWVIPRRNGAAWYVDGRGVGAETGGWGKDLNHQDGWGHFPDKPKLTVSFKAGADDAHNGIIFDRTRTVPNPNGEGYVYGPYKVFDPSKDVIYVVGPVSALKEEENSEININRVWENEYTLDPDSLYPLHNYKLKLFRYPGGHKMSNDSIDLSGTTTLLTQEILGNDDTFGDYDGLPEGVTTGPGANYDAMIVVDSISDKQGNITLNNVLVDGLYGHTQIDDGFHEIPTSFDQDAVHKPLVVMGAGTTLTLKSVEEPDDPTQEGTELQRGYNNTKAAYYYDPDYDDDAADDPDNVFATRHGGAVYVHRYATMNAEGKVTVKENLQNLDQIVYNENGEEAGTTPVKIESNVYLPTFKKHTYITGPLDQISRIGITSPIRNAEPHFTQNTMSPIAEATNANIAYNAWNNENYYDDLARFFYRGYQDDFKTTYYEQDAANYSPALVDAGDDETIERTLYFGWTWNNVVTRKPAEFLYDNIDSPEDLAWLISLVNGLNGRVANDLSAVDVIEEKADIDLVQYVWLPVGDQISGVKPFGSKFDGRGHIITNLSMAYFGMGDGRYNRVNYGMFGAVDGGVVDRTFVLSGYIEPVSDLNHKGDANIGTLVGMLGTEGASKPKSMVSNSEGGADIVCAVRDDAFNVGSVIGYMVEGELHSSMGMSDIKAEKSYKEGGYIGGLVGRAEPNVDGKVANINNSFSNPKLMFGASSDVKAGGLVGYNVATIKNCYSRLQEKDSTDNHVTNAKFKLLAFETKMPIILGHSFQTPEYEQAGFDAGFASLLTNCYHYTDPMSADRYRYIYNDNKLQVEDGGGWKDIAEDETCLLFNNLNQWVEENNGEGHKYSLWVRPTITGINDDFPILHLCDWNDQSQQGLGDFRSMATWHGGPKLQYAGPVRDYNELNSMVDRMTTKDYMYVYGDVAEVLTASVDTANIYRPAQLSVYEHAAILHPGTLAGHPETYVGVTFDNSCAHAYSTPGINHIEDSLFLPRDWHMFSSTLSNAPLGFNYDVNGVNTNLAEHYPVNPQGNAINNGTYYNNPWPYIDEVAGSTYGEFTWLNSGGNDINRYWMKGWENSQSQNCAAPEFDESKWVDGYFPSSVAGQSEFGDGCIEGEDEYGRFPYGMDMFCWYEPEPHWINFKRNGPNHWHSDEINPDVPHNQHVHKHLPYTEKNEDDTEDISNQNEDYLKIGKGYMFAIAKKTYLQSHGNLNAEAKNRAVTRLGRDFPGWNLVGNPYHAYLDFEQFLTKNGSVEPYYVIYDADGYKGGPKSAYLYYPDSGSDGGEYADPYLHPHQGFFIKTNNGNIPLTFDESMSVTRSDASDVAYRSRSYNYPLVNLYLSSEKGCSDVTVIEFHRPSWGGAKKQKGLRQGNGLFYAYHENEPYAALFAKEGAERVPLRFEAKEDDVYTMRWNTANGYFSSLYLIDNLTGARYDMLANDSYVFEGHKDDYYSRFYITFDCLDVEEYEEDEVEKTFAFFDGSQWVVTGEGSLELIDLQGRILWQERVSGGQSRVSIPDVAKSLYLLRLVNSSEGTKVQKIVID